MPSTTPRFAWKDRDTAARDLIQVAYYAPASVRRRALQLLKAFRSAAIFPELEQLVLDEDRDIWERRYALRAIAAIPDDLYLPQFARFASAEGSLSFEDLLDLVSEHPSNLQWLFQSIEQLEPKVYLKVLRNSTFYFGQGKGLNPILCQQILAALEVNPPLLDLELADTLYYRDGSEATLAWLHQRWDTLIYLCVSSEKKAVFGLLAGWDQLREAIFRNCPAMIEEYDQIKQEMETLRLQRRSASVDYQFSREYQELYLAYQAARDGKVQGYWKLEQLVYHEMENLCKRAVATHLLGKLKEKYDVRSPLFHALRYAPDDDQYQHFDMNASVRFEAGEALRDMPSPDVWETMVDAYFIRPRNGLESFMEDWIAYLTDRLSGSDVPYSGMTWGDESKRFWFRALAEMD